MLGGMSGCNSYDIVCMCKDTIGNSLFFLQMKFAVYDLNKDSLEVTVFDKDLFSPNGKIVPWQLFSIYPAHW